MKLIPATEEYIERRLDACDAAFRAIQALDECGNSLGVPYYNDSVLKSQDEALAWFDDAIGTLERRGSAEPSARWNGG